MATNTYSIGDIIPASYSPSDILASVKPASAPARLSHRRMRRMMKLAKKGMADLQPVSELAPNAKIK